MGQETNQEILKRAESTFMPIYKGSWEHGYTVSISNPNLVAEVGKDNSSNNYFGLVFANRGRIDFDREHPDLIAINDLPCGLLVKKDNDVVLLVDDITHEVIECAPTINCLDRTPLNLQIRMIKSCFRTISKQELLSRIAVLLIDGSNNLIFVEGYLGDDIDLGNGNLIISFAKRTIEKNIVIDSTAESQIPIPDSVSEQLKLLENRKAVQYNILPPSINILGYIIDANINGVEWTGIWNIVCIVDGYKIYEKVS